MAVMQSFMATGAESDQVGLFISALLTAELLVMDMQVLSRAADLTLPAIPAHYLPAELLVRDGI